MLFATRELRSTFLPLMAFLGMVACRACVFSSVSCAAKALTGVDSRRALSLLKKPRSICRRGRWSDCSFGLCSSRRDFFGAFLVPAR